MKNYILWFLLLGLSSSTVAQTGFRLDSLPQQGVLLNKGWTWHAAKGPLFDSLIVSELLKDRFNRGESDNLFYWRDKTGHEVDILTETDGHRT